MTYHELVAFLPALFIMAAVLFMIMYASYSSGKTLNNAIPFIVVLISLISLVFINNVVPIKNNLFLIDRWSILFSVLILFSSFFILVISRTWLCFNNFNPTEYYALFLISVLGGIVLTYANNFITFLVGIELLSIPIFGLIAYSNQKASSLEAAIKYSVLSSIASAFLLFSMGLIYIEFSSLNFENIGQSLDLKNMQFTSKLGFAMMLIGFLSKLSFVPFNLWIADIYQGSPISITAFLGISKFAIFIVLARFVAMSCLTYNSSFYLVLTIIIAFSIFLGSFMALLQRNVKRLLGYSSITHFGYLGITLICISNNYAQSYETMYVYLFSYAINSLGVFLFISVFQTGDKNQTYSYRGLFWRNPFLALAMTIILFSFAGMPLTFGFISKLYIISLALSCELWFLTSVILISSAFGLYYYLRLISVLYLDSSFGKETISDISVLHSCSIFFIAIITLYFGLFPQRLLLFMNAFY